VSAKTKLRNSLYAIEDARKILKRLKHHDDAGRDVRKALKELDSAESEIERAIRETD